jgi:hypothetical protein
MDFPRRANSPRHEREKSRVTLQLSAEQKNAIDWLSRVPLPFRAKLPRRFQQLAGLASRTIARELSGASIRELVKIHEASRSAENN